MISPIYRSLMTYSLRPAATDDVEAMWRIQRFALGDIITAEFGTTTHEQRVFFDEHIEVEAHQIIVARGADCGFLFTEWRGDHLYLGNLIVEPSHQNMGIGTSILGDLIASADAAQHPIRLQVLKGNPAIRFYEKFGFVVDRVSEHHHQMVRAPRSDSSQDIDP